MGIKLGSVSQIMPQVPLLCPVPPRGTVGLGGFPGYDLNPVPGMDGEGLGLFTGINHRAEVTL